MFNNFFFSKNLAVWDVKKNRRVEQTTDDTAFAHYSLDTKGHKHTHSEYARGISLTLQHWLHEGASVLRYTYIDCLALHSWFFRGKAARTFTNIISSPPILQNNPLRYRRIPVRIVCSLAIPPPLFALWNKLFSEACFFTNVWFVIVVRGKKKTRVVFLWHVSCLHHVSMKPKE